MPNSAYWSAGMLLRWILTRDRAAVLAMLDDCGGVRVDLDSGTATLLRLMTWEEAQREAAIDPSLPREEQIREAVHRSEKIIIPATGAICDALERGCLTAQARRNGSGDIEAIGSAQWRGLKIWSHDGRDLAVPVDANRQMLQLPWPHSAYLSGEVPSRATPTVWVDPEFPATEIIRLWPSPSAGDAAMTADVEPIADQTASNGLRSAPEEKIHEAIIAVYDAAEVTGEKPPNIKEIVEPVQKKLRAVGYSASGRHIETLAGEDRHKSRRRKPGTTVTSEKSRTIL